LLAFQAIYSQVDSIGTWGKGEMVIFIGTFSLINSLNMIIFFFGILTIPDKIRSGELDLYLSKPINPLLRITFENANPGSIPLVLFSIIIIGYGVTIGDYNISLVNILEYLALVILMTLLFYDLMVIIRTISFFVISTAGISRLEETSLDLCMKIPGVVFKGIFKVMFYVLMPYGIIATIPTQCLTNSLTLQGLLFGVGIVIIFTMITMKFWKFGLRHYNSVNS
jgi:ABC-2 type transport system permease protein